LHIAVQVKSASPILAVRDVINEKNNSREYDCCFDLKARKDDNDTFQPLSIIKIDNFFPVIG
jgi:hypothetical protein